MKTYDVNYFIEKFEKIPAERWIIGMYHRDDKFCALGFCSPVYYDWERIPMSIQERTDVVSGVEQDALYVLFWERLNLVVMQVNDYKTLSYQQETPKERVLAALQDIKDKQEKAERVAAIEKAKNTISEPIKTEEYVYD